MIKPDGTQKIVPLVFEEEETQARPPGGFKPQKNNSHCQKMATII